MSGVVAYLQRQAGGLLITRARLVGDGWSGEWAAPERPAPADPSSGSGDADDALDRARGAGAWIAQQLGVRRVRALDSLVVDGDGALCLWLGTPSTEPNVVAAALLQGGSRAEGDGGSGDAVMYAAAEGAGTERSIQASGAPDHTTPAPRRSLLTSRSQTATAVADAPRQRMAVMSVPDAAVRVVLDVLDVAGIAVDSVTSLWHAAARAWDPSANPSDDAAKSSSRFAAESGGGATAVVLVDPIGRLMWCWTRGARMLACGSMLLRRVEVGGAIAELLEGPDGAAVAGALTAVECSDAEASRLCVDWLGWSAQLGVSPERIVYVGPAAAGGGPGRAFAQAIGERWPGAFVDAATDDDPVGVTLARARTSVPWQDHETAVDDGQRALVDLSQRPGRTHRSYYRWFAGAVAAVAVVVAAVGWKMRSAAADAQAQLDALRGTRTEALKTLETRIPGLSMQPDPVGRIRGYINELRARAERVRPEVPLMNEFQRVIAALSEFPGVKITLIDLTNVTAMVKVNVPDADTGPKLTERIKELPGQLNWTGASAGSTPGTAGRAWTLTGQWVSGTPKPPAGGTNP